MVKKIFIMILFFNIYVLGVCNTTSFEPKSRFFLKQTIACIKKVKKYLLLKKSHIKLNTTLPVQAIKITHNKKTKKIQEIDVFFLTTNKGITFFFDKFESIYKFEILEIHPLTNESLSEYNYKKVSSWDKLFELYFIRSIKYLDKNAKLTNYLNRDIYFSLDEDKRSNKRDLRYEIWLIDKIKMSTCVLKFNSSMKIISHKIQKYDETPAGENLLH